MCQLVFGFYFQLCLFSCWSTRSKRNTMHSAWSNASWNHQWDSCNKQKLQGKQPHWKTHRVLIPFQRRGSWNLKSMFEHSNPCPDPTHRAELKLLLGLLLILFLTDRFYGCSSCSQIGPRLHDCSFCLTALSAFFEFLAPVWLVLLCVLDCLECLTKSRSCKDVSVFVQASQ